MNDDVDVDEDGNDVGIGADGGDEEEIDERFVAFKY